MVIRVCIHDGSGNVNGALLFRGCRIRFCFPRVTSTGFAFRRIEAELCERGLRMFSGKLNSQINGFSAAGNDRHKSTVTVNYSSVM